jgi:centromere/kinetochore protein ZW10
VRQAGAGESLHAAVKESAERVEFLAKEAIYNKQVGDALRGIKNVRDLLDQAEKAAVERKILSALHILSSKNQEYPSRFGLFADHCADAWDVIYAIPANARTRAIRLLDDRAFALRASVYENFNAVWGALVHIDADTASITVNNELEGERFTKYRVMGRYRILIWRSRCNGH